MAVMVSFGVQNSHDNYIVSFDSVKHLVWKTLCQKPAKSPIIQRMTFGGAFKQSQNAANFV